MPLGEDMLSLAVWSTNLHPMSRLPSARHCVRLDTLHPRAVSPVRRIHHRACGRAVCQGRRCSDEEGRLPSATAGEAQTPSYVDTDRIRSWDKRDPELDNRHDRGLLLHPPSGYRDPVRASRRDSLVEDMLVCIHEPRPPTRTLVTFLSRSIAGGLQVLSVSSQHHAQEPDVLLVGANARVSARIPQVLQHQMDVRCQTCSGGGWPKYCYLDCFCAVCRTTATELSGQDFHLGLCLNRGAPDEAFHHFIILLACWFLRSFPIVPERSR